MFFPVLESSDFTEFALNLIIKCGTISFYTSDNYYFSILYWHVKCGLLVYQFGASFGLWTSASHFVCILLRKSTSLLRSRHVLLPR